MKIRNAIAKSLTRIKLPEVHNFDGLSISKVRTEIVNFDTLAIPSQDSISVLHRPDTLEISDRLESSPTIELSEFSFSSDIEIDDHVLVGFRLPEVEIPNEAIGVWLLPCTKIADGIVNDELFSPKTVSLLEPLSPPKALGKDYRTRDTDGWQ